MKRILLSLFSIATLVGATGSAQAVAHHKVEAIQKIVKGGKLWGARVHLLVDPEAYTKFRINLAPKARVPAPLRTSGHRAALGNITGDFVLLTLAEQSKVKGLRELYVDIPYGKVIKAGSKLNLFSAYATGRDAFTTKSPSPHIFGAWDGPVIRHDASHIIELPTLKSKAPLATRKLAMK